MSSRQPIRPLGVMSPASSKCWTLCFPPFPQLWHSYSLPHALFHSSILSSSPSHPRLSYHWLAGGYSRRDARRSRPWNTTKLLVNTGSWCCCVKCLGTAVLAHPTPDVAHPTPDVAHPTSRFLPPSDIHITRGSTNFRPKVPGHP